MKLKLSLLNGLHVEVEASPEEVMAITGATTGIGGLVALLHGLAKADTGRLQDQTTREG